MLTAEILNSHPVSTLKKEIRNTNIRGYSKMSKAELVAVMLKNKERFSHIKMNTKEPRAKPKPKPKPVEPKPKPKPKPKPVEPKPKPKPVEPKPKPKPVEPKKPEEPKKPVVKQVQNSLDDLINELKKYERNEPVNFQCYNSIAMFLYYEVLERSKNDCFFKLPVDTEQEGQTRGLNLAKKASILSLSDLRNPIIQKLIVNAARQCKARGVPIMAIMTFKAGHANCILINSDLKTVEHYEPHGTGTKPFDNAIRDLTKQFSSKKPWTYIPSGQTCPYLPPKVLASLNPRFVEKGKTGLQMYDGTKEQNVQRSSSGIKDTGGFCCIWTFLHMEYRLKYPNLPPNELGNRLLKELKDNEGGFDRTKTRNLIRGYTHTLIGKLINKFKSDRELKQFYAKAGRRSNVGEVNKVLDSLVKIKL